MVLSVLTLGEDFLCRNTCPKVRLSRRVIFSYFKFFVLKMYVLFQAVWSLGLLLPIIAPLCVSASSLAGVGHADEVMMGRGAQSNLLEVFSAAKQVWYCFHHCEDQPFEVSILLQCKL